MRNDAKDTRAQGMPSGKPESEGPANTLQDKASGTVKPQDGPMNRFGTEAEDAANNPMNSVPVTSDDPNVGLSEKPDLEIDGNRGM